MADGQDKLAGDVAALNIIITWLARRDVPDAAAAKADAMLLLGGIPSAPYADAVAAAFAAGAAPSVMLVGGAGHSTQRLRDAVAAEARFAGIATAGRAEAAILRDVLTQRLGVPAEAIGLVEAASTNCGNNASYALRDLRAAGGPLPSRVLLVQDALMQRRSHESFAHEWRGAGVEFVSWTPFVPLLRAEPAAPERVAFVDGAHAAMWPMRPFLDLVMGEVPRLRPTGYGPEGAGFIGHVDVPPAVEAAFARLLPRWGQHVRAADPAAATAAVAAKASA